jgi:hypothetical protein
MTHAEEIRVVREVLQDPTRPDRWLRADEDFQEIYTSVHQIHPCVYIPSHNGDCSDRLAVTLAYGLIRLL